MEERHVEILYETLAKIFEEKENVKISVVVKQKEN
jgi:hypothetical protein